MDTKVDTGVSIEFTTNLRRLEKGRELIAFWSRGKTEWAWPDL
jgi:hypothetical protein